jgi:hypothetical protein
LVRSKTWHVYWGDRSVIIQQDVHLGVLSTEKLEFLPNGKGPWMILGRPTTGPLYSRATVGAASEANNNFGMVIISVQPLVPSAARALALPTAGKCNLVSTFIV